MWYRLRIESPRGSVALMGRAGRDAVIEAMPRRILKSCFEPSSAEVLLEAYGDVGCESEGS
jgi:hypothetical protein